MRNRIEKNNMTKFDYTARTLGIVGACLIAATFAFGGTLLVSVVSENRSLAKSLTATERYEEKKTRAADSAEETDGYVVLMREDA